MTHERPTVVLVGTLDTKGREHEFVRDRLREAAVDVIVVDCGVLGEPGFVPDVSAAAVASAAGADLAELRGGSESNDARTRALTTMERGAIAIVRGLRAAGRCDGVMGLGGSGGSTIVSGVLRSLPLGVPKLLVSTLASGNAGSFIGTSDICLVHPVTDVQGLNRISRPILTNAANAIAGMARGRRAAAAPAASASSSDRADSERPDTDRPLVALTMMGVTTPAVQRAQAALEAAGFETVVFHAVGSGGRAMEEMIAAGLIDGVVDLTTSEITAFRYGGILSAGPDRLTAAGRTGTPQVVAPGALEVLNFGPRQTVPPAWDGPARRLVVHNPSITSVRLEADEAAVVGAILAEKVSASTGPTAVLLPLGGCTKYELPDGPFVDPAADRAMFDAIRDGLRPGILLLEVDANLNDPAFADAAVETFLSLWEARRAAGEPGAAAAHRA